MTYTVHLFIYNEHKGDFGMFSCDKCGLCCMHIDESSLDEGLDRGDGVCKYFDEETHLCQIYADRPIFCNVDKFYDEHLSSKYSKEEFYA